MNTAARHRALLIPLAGAALLLTACATTSPQTTKTPQANPIVQSASDTTDVTTADTADDTAGDTGSTAGASGGLTGTACLAGSWYVDPAADSQRIEDYLSASATDITVTTGGDGTMTFTNDTVAFAYENETITEAFTVDGQKVVVSSSRNGTITDPYTATENTIEVPGHEPDPELEWQFNVKVDGVASALPLPGEANFITGGLDNTSGVWGYQCTGDELIFYWLDGPKTVDDAIQAYVRR